MIVRQPAEAARRNYDLIIIGGGIYGVMLSFEASKRGLSVLLLERSDFGSGTTFNCLRTLHGGFRYLQTMDLHRFRESVSERSWFLKNYPEFVSPLPCLMPLYGNGLHRPSVLRVAGWMNDALSCKRNDGVQKEKQLPGTRIIKANQVKRNFKAVDVNDLKGGVVWYDAYMPDSQLVLIDILRWSCEKGAMALNYVEAKELVKSKSGVAGVVATDLEDAETYEFKAGVVINAAGPWCSDVAVRFDRKLPDLFKTSLAWNILFNRAALSSHALALAPKKAGARTYFVLPFKGKLLAGTGHSPWSKGPEAQLPGPEMIQGFIDDLNHAVPSLELTRKDIIHVFAGLLPVTEPGGIDLVAREVIVNHSQHGGPPGLYSISGVKFTTARLVAEKTLKRVFPEREVLQAGFAKPPGSISDSKEKEVIPPNFFESRNDQEWKRYFKNIIDERAVLHLDDLIYRRSTLWEHPKRALEMAPGICELFNWDDSRRRVELQRLSNLNRVY